MKSEGSRVDAESRRAHGVYRTPRLLVDYVVRSVDILLQDRLGLAAGVADPRARLLDPAAGPLDFLRAACHRALARHGRCAARLTGVEILESQFSRGLVAARRFARTLGCAGKGMQVMTILGDALEPRPEIFDRSFNVVLGNPPWRGHSSHRGAWMSDLLHGYRLPDGREDEGYFRAGGEPLGERNPKWLNDDCIKYLRLAQWLIDRNGEGVVALVLNHNFLDAPTFRGVRASLLRTFQEIHVLDLHGNQRKREGGPPAGRDENVFRGVAQGAAVLFAVRKPGLPQRVWHAELCGTRRAKLATLARGGL